jgi:hypothetical protein
MHTPGRSVASFHNEYTGGDVMSYRGELKSSSPLDIKIQNAYEDPSKAKKAPKLVKQFRSVRNSSRHTTGQL